MLPPSLLALCRTILYYVVMPKPPKDRLDLRKKTVLYVRDAPLSLARKLRAAAALAGYRGISDYIIGILTKHTEELERQGTLPKPK